MNNLKKQAISIFIILIVFGSCCGSFYRVNDLNYSDRYNSVNNNRNVLHPNQFNSQDRYYQDPSSVEHDNLTFPINLSFSNYSSGFINKSNKINLPTSPNPKQVEVTFSNITEDVFDFNQVLVPKILNNGTGTLLPDYDNLTEFLSFSINNTNFNNDFNVITNTNVEFGDELELIFINSQFIFNEADLAFSNVIVNFDTFTLVLLLSYSQVYFDLGLTQNSSKTIKLDYSQLNQIKVPLDLISNQTNIIPPSKINSISFNVYKNSNYNFFLTLETFKLLRSKQTVDLFRDGQLITQVTKYQFTVTQNTSSQITLSKSNIFATYSVLLNETTMLLSRAKLLYLDDNLFIQHNISIREMRRGYLLKINLNQEFQIISGKIGLNNEIELNNNTLEYYITKDIMISQISIMTSTKFLGNWQKRVSQPVQGSRLFISNISQNIIAVLGIHISSGFHLQFTQIESGFYSDIPSNLSKSNIQLFFIQKGGGHFSYSQKLSLNPSIIDFVPRFTINPAIDFYYPLNLINLTSNNILPADNIKLYYNSVLISTENSKYLTIRANNFSPGNYSVYVNISAKGLVSQYTELTLIVEIFSPEIIFLIKRNSVSEIIIEFRIDEYPKWSLFSYMNFSYDSFSHLVQVVHSTFTINLYSTQFPSSQFYFQSNLYLINSNLSYKFEILINEIRLQSNSDNINYQSTTNDLLQKNKDNDNRDFLLLIVTSTISGILLITLKFMRKKMDENVIEF